MLAPTLGQTGSELTADLLLRSELLGRDSDLRVWNEQWNLIAPGRKCLQELRVLSHEPTQLCSQPVGVLLQAFDEGVEFFGG
ncbi:hypothetical protein D3C84_691310 [compost metagenome]